MIAKNCFEQDLDDSLNLFASGETMKPGELRNITIQAEQILKTIENQIALSKKFPRNQSLNNHRMIASAKTSNRTANPVRPISAVTKPIVVPQPKSLYDTTVSMNTFKLDQILGTGRGAYATVRLSTNKQSKQQFAVKIYEKCKLSDPMRMNNLKREIELLKEMDHPNIIKLYHAVEDKRSINLVMEYISSQSLAVFAKSRPNRQVSNVDALHIFNQLALAVKYLHDHNIAHRDIKMENILLDPKGNVKLIDFGFSIKVPKNRKLNIFCGTPSYMSPEIVSKTPHVPFTSDIWSLGVLLSTLVTGQHPFKGCNDRDLYRNIQLSKWKPPEGVKIEANTARLITGCLEKVHTKRWSVGDLLTAFEN